MTTSKIIYWEADEPQQLMANLEITAVLCDRKQKMHCSSECPKHFVNRKRCLTKDLSLFDLYWATVTNETLMGNVESY